MPAIRPVTESGCQRTSFVRAIWCFLLTMKDGARSTMWGCTWETGPLSIPPAPAIPSGSTGCPRIPTGKSFAWPAGTMAVKPSHKKRKRAHLYCAPCLSSLSAASALPEYHLFQPLHPADEILNRRIRAGILGGSGRCPLGFAELFLQALILLDQILVILDDQIQKFIHFIDIVTANGMFEILIENIHRRQPLHVEDPSPSASATHSLLYYDSATAHKITARIRRRVPPPGSGRRFVRTFIPRWGRFGGPCP